MYKVIAGTNVISRSSRTTTGRTLSISKIIIHPDVGIITQSGLRSLTVLQDIALIKMRRELRYSDTIAPVCLSPFATIPVGPCYATGWGRTSNCKYIWVLLHEGWRLLTPALNLAIALRKGLPLHIQAVRVE